MNHLERLGDSFSIPIPTDEDGYLGRECKNEDCLGYFKIMPGTGLEDATDCHCPYCGHTDEQSEFTTKDQLDYAESRAIRQITDAITKDFKKMEFDIKPKGAFGIGMSMKVKSGPRHPLHYYREQELETHVECNNCTLKYAVFGAFGFCPDCGIHNSLQIFKKSIDIVKKTLELADKNDDKDLTERLIENALEDCISSFDGFGRELCLVNATRSTAPDKVKKISFQNIAVASDKVERLFGYQMQSTVSGDDWEKVIRGFQKRHLISHKMGVIDEEYIAKTNDTSAVKGRKITISTKEVEELASLLINIAGALSQNIG